MAVWEELTFAAARLPIVLPLTSTITAQQFLYPFLRIIPRSETPMAVSDVSSCARAKGSAASPTVECSYGVSKTGGLGILSRLIVYPRTLHLALNVKFALAGLPAATVTF